MIRKHLRGRFGFILCLLLAQPEQAGALVQITNVNDFSFGTWSGTGDLVITDGICIYEDVGNRRYVVRPTGSGSGSAFTLSGGSSTLAYSVAWVGSGGGGFTTLTSGSNTNFTQSSRTVNCGGGTNATLQITISAANLLAAEAATYTGTLTLTIQPN